ncbi:MAG: magnesium/cobalt transporter CorA [Proteobacteria bacterium]|nr:magnesium/cobalt transporter CorA [Pseudomonadota bacterium]MBU1741836.1 magnesium/cobalt transporter CorA [Pseudomonadota bacterium]
MIDTVSTVSEKAALPPGTLVHVGEILVDHTRVTMIDYNPEGYEVVEDPSDDRLAQAADNGTVSWIRVVGLHEVEVTRRLGERFDLHSLVLEDILNTQHRPKVDEYPGYLFLVFKTFAWEDGETLRARQISLVLGQGYVVSFEEGPDSALDAIQERIARGRGRIRRMGADYLAYALLDTAMDGFFGVLERFGERIEEVEEEVLEHPGPRTVAAIHQVKRQSLSLRRAVWPLREVIGLLQRGESELVGDNTRIYFRDVYDHTIQIMDSIESLRDIMAGLLDVHLSSVSNRLNQIMKVLTIIATIFIPLTFVTGFYGMNFKHMPELEWKWAYPVVVGIMAGAAALMLAMFRRRKWM